MRATPKIQAGHFVRGVAGQRHRIIERVLDDGGLLAIDQQPRGFDHKGFEINRQVGADHVAIGIQYIAFEHFKVDGEVKGVALDGTNLIIEAAQLLQLLVSCLLVDSLDSAQREGRQADQRQAEQRLGTVQEILQPSLEAGPRLSETQRAGRRRHSSNKCPRIRGRLNDAWSAGLKRPNDRRHRRESSDAVPV